MSRDRANFRVQIRVQTQSDDSACEPKSNRRAGPPGSLPPGPPSSVSDQSAVEQEVAHVLLSCARGQTNHQYPNTGTAGTGAACSGVAALVPSSSAIHIPSVAPPNRQWCRQHSIMPTAPAKRPAPPESAAVPRAKRAYKT
eukprot:scaffold10289_cov47-Phaeocystis_antarctica.AAC.1